MNIEYRISNVKRRSLEFAAVLLCSFALLGPVAGCDNNKHNLTEQIVTLREQKIELAISSEKPKPQTNKPKDKFRSFPASHLR